MLLKNINLIFFTFIITLINIHLISNQDIDRNNDNKQTKEYINQRKIESLRKAFYNEWDEKMENYTVEYVYYISLEQNVEEIYFENVTIVPTVFKGAFFLSDDTADIIEFYIKDPNHKIIYNVNKHFGIFEIKINKTGLYTIYFLNKFSKNNIVVTLTMNTGENNLITSKDLNNTERKIDDLEAIIKKFNMEFKLTRDIHTKRYKSK